MLLYAFMLASAWKISIREPSNRGRVFASTALIFALIVTAAPSGARAGEGEDLFEKVIRPYLVERCYECHATHGTREQDLAVDWAGGLSEGGASGPAVVPGKPTESVIMTALRHEDSLLMPKGGPKPAPEIVKAFERWIEVGAPDPRREAPSADALAKETSWEAIFARRKQWWSLQPIGQPAVPPRSDEASGWLAQSDHPVDRFLAAKLAAAGIAAAGEADPDTLLRRATFVLTGLPPTPAERAAFLADTSIDRWERLVDRLIDSPPFAERWARHWLDCVRYCETHGSEGDPAIPFAWRYRDWCIRAIRDDVAIDRFIREQIAGDLLADPRIDAETGTNESALGIGHLRMVPHGYTPTDALDELVSFTDNQIDVVSKAFLGMTVSCARCHNHKFDAISQADFYALFGTLTSCRPAVIEVDAAGRRDTHRAELAELKRSLRESLATAWLDAIAIRPDSVREGLAKAAAERPARAWPRPPAVQAEGRGTAADLDAWYRSGSGLGPTTPPGEFRIEPEGDRIVSGLLPAGVHSNLLVANDGAVLHSPSFEVRSDAIHVLVAGAGKARLRIVVRNYPRVGLIYPQTTLEQGKPQWVRIPTAYWKGEQAHLEIATAGDLPVDPLSPGQAGAGRSWFSVAAVDLSGAVPEPLATAIGDPSQLAAAISAWRAGEATGDDVAFIDVAVAGGVLPTSLDDLRGVQPLVERFRTLDQSVPAPTRAAGVVEGTVADQPLFIRGNHKQPGDVVPRRFLDALDPTPFPPGVSGRRQLADALVAETNPLTPRVFVNRVWHHVFGRGIVASVDTFGEMGDLPTHPELLDYLATAFIKPAAAGVPGPTAQPWSLKALVRLFATSRAFRLAAQPTESARRLDPANAFFSHARLRRLEGEAVRDAILATAGRLARTPYGPPVAGASGRRSIYVHVIRNASDPFLAAFDPPSTQSTQGRRDESHVPAQALVLMNGSFVRDAAHARAARLLSEWRDLPVADRVSRLFVETLGREPAADELAATTAWLETRAAGSGVAAKDIGGSAPLWADLFHAIVNLEEFVHVD
jgi:cytochrome c553